MAITRLTQTSATAVSSVHHHPAHSSARPNRNRMKSACTSRSLTQSLTYFRPVTSERLFDLIPILLTAQDRK
ncbi:hypothetical protein CY34DRAFT_802148 [Suillus luteus UH-Slu-Lm8-n1]|uniref:Uncharacterized protein n=1 Tax=Suillus luteus UH-Slu-Lm8-n1 TaxID=930992 RepID=A0A0D0BP34_9AGAM|nr:hypothetical protein CY34DRAFT_802148 [Suillus luteus UH-Slu-Lm8-n1]